MFIDYAKITIKAEMVVMVLLVSGKKNIFQEEVLMEVMEVMAVPL
jgi:hypothetical protein